MVNARFSTPIIGKVKTGRIIVLGNFQNITTPNYLKLVPLQEKQISFMDKIPVLEPKKENNLIESYIKLLENDYSHKRVVNKVKPLPKFKKYDGVQLQMPGIQTIKQTETKINGFSKELILYEIEKELLNTFNLKSNIADIPDSKRRIEKSSLFKKTDEEIQQVYHLLYLYLEKSIDKEMKWIKNGYIDNDVLKLCYAYTLDVAKKINKDPNQWSIFRGLKYSVEMIFFKSRLMSGLSFNSICAIKKDHEKQLIFKT